MTFPWATWDGEIDLVAVERAASCLGVCSDLTEREQQRAVLVMTEAGKSIVVISKRLGISDRTVSRWRDEMGSSP